MAKKTAVWPARTSSGFITIPMSKLHDIEEAVTQCFGYLTITNDLLARYMEQNGSSMFRGMAATGVDLLADQTLQRLHGALETAFAAARKSGKVQARTSSGFITIPMSKLHDIEEAVTQCFGYLTITNDLLARYMEQNGSSMFRGMAATGVDLLADQTLQRLHGTLEAAFAAARESREVQ